MFRVVGNTFARAARSSSTAALECKGLNGLFLRHFRRLTESFIYLFFLRMEQIIIFLTNKSENKSRKSSEASQAPQ